MIKLESDSYANGYLRIISALIDGVLLLVLVQLPQIASELIDFLTSKGVQAQGQGHSIFFDNSLHILIFVGYFVLCDTSQKGATIGKMVTKTKVVDAYGKRIGVMVSIGRSCGRIATLLTMGVGLLLVLTGKRTTLHDRLSSTFVVKR